MKDKQSKAKKFPSFAERYANKMTVTQLVSAKKQAKAGKGFGWRRNHFGKVKK